MGNFTVENIFLLDLKIIVGVILVFNTIFLCVIPACHYQFGVYDTVIPNYSARKNAEDLKKNLENVVVPMFCNASIGNIFIIMPSRSRSLF